ncbi:hypothetical protein F4779DRAFT_198542 [Xylariaceae sp. FL0662B]|nr:hypothetical protein F4779DRAFT_198542 [Xylariaceae sp. FL0662B]
MTVDIKSVLIVADSYVPVTLKAGSDGYKGTERELVYIMRYLEQRQIIVHLIAPAGSDEPALPGKLWISCKRPLWDFDNPRNYKEGELTMVHKENLDETSTLINKVVTEENPDIVDCHIAHQEKIYQTLVDLPVPHLITLHGPLYGKESLIEEAINKYPTLIFATVSLIQREPLNKKQIFPNYVDPLPNGLPDDPPKPHIKKEKGHVAMLCRISPKKAVDRGIKIAERAGMRLTIAGVVLDDGKDREWYDKVLAPMLEEKKDIVTVNPGINETNKTDFLQRHTALLALTKRDNDEKWGDEVIESDGMHISEALRAGLPVICDEGIDKSKVPPSVGFRCENDDEIVNVLSKDIQNIDPQACRNYFLGNFSIEVTVQKRINAWNKIISNFQGPLRVV